MSKQRTVAQIAEYRRQKVLTARGWRSLIRRVLFLALVGCLLFGEVFLIRQNTGQGMFPSLKDGDLCIAFRTQAQELTGEKYVRDDIVFYTEPTETAGLTETIGKPPLSQRVTTFLNVVWEDVKDGCAYLLYRLGGNPALRAPEVYAGRIIATGGDVVMMNEGGTLLVNGTPQSGEIMYPTYVRGNLEYPYRVPDGCVYILGDYRTNTKDSRDFGAIPLGDVMGKVITILRRRGL